MNWKITALLFTLASTFLLAGCFSFNDEKPPEQPADISLAALEARMRQSMDPNGRFRKAKSYVQKQMLDIKQGWDEKNYIVEVKFKRPDRFMMTNLENNLPVNSVIFNGSKAWLVDYGKKRSIAITGVRLEKLKVFFALGRPDNTYQKIFASVKITQCVLDGKPYYKLKCISKIPGQDPFFIYVGKNNFLTKRLETIERIGGEPRNYTSTIDKYSLYEGVMIPAETTTVMNDVKQKFKVILYKLDVPVRDFEFTPPNFSSEERNSVNP